MRFAILLVSALPWLVEPIFTHALARETTRQQEEQVGAAPDLIGTVWQWQQTLTGAEEMFRRAGRGGRMAQPVRENSGGRPSVVEVVGQRLVEHEFWDWLCLGGIEGRSLVQEKVSLGRTASG